MKKQEEATVQIINLLEKSKEKDLHQLFISFCFISRVYLIKEDKPNNTSKDFTFLTFNEKKDAKKKNY